MKKKTNGKTPISLDDMPYSELLRMEEALIKAKASARASAIAEARDHVIAHLAERGLKPSDIFPKLGSSGNPKSPASHIKYRDPNNRANAWSGMGKKPGWVREHLTQGGQLADLEA